MRQSSRYVVLIGYIKKKITFKPIRLKMVALILHLIKLLSFLLIWHLTWKTTNGMDEFELNTRVSIYINIIYVDRHYICCRQVNIFSLNGNYVNFHHSIITCYSLRTLISRLHNRNMHRIYIYPYPSILCYGYPVSGHHPSMQNLLYSYCSSPNLIEIDLY